MSLYMGNQKVAPVKLGVTNQNKTITSNGTYSADAGYTGLGNVTVNVDTGVPQATVNAILQSVSDTYDVCNDKGAPMPDMQTYENLAATVATLGAYTPPPVYEFLINTTESNPSNAVTYAGVNASFTPASINFSTGAINYGSWGDAFFQPRPVMLKSNGTVDYELNHSDFTKKLDGSVSDISNTSYDGNCMIAFPQVWYKVVAEGNYQHVYITSYQADSDYHCYTHYNSSGTLLDEIFVMAFEPANINSKLRSLAGQTILVSTSGETMRTYAQANGSGWDFFDYGTINMIQMLLVLMFKTLDSQTAIGAGITGSSSYSASSSTYTTTGGLKDKPMFYATQSGVGGNTPIKVFGIENLWGNRYKWMNGLVSDGTNAYLKLCNYTADGSTGTGYNQTGSGYINLGTFPNSSGYQSASQIKCGCLIPSTSGFSGSTSTYYCDYNYLYSNGSYFARFGGYYSGTAGNAGLFFVALTYELSNSSPNFGASLTCKP